MGCFDPKGTTDMKVTRCAECDGLARVSIGTRVFLAGVLFCGLVLGPWASRAADGVSLKPNCPPSQGCDPHWGSTPGYGTARVVWVNVGNIAPGPMIQAFIDLLNVWNQPWIDAGKPSNWPYPLTAQFKQATSSCRPEGNYTINICAGALPGSDERGLTSAAIFTGGNHFAYATIEVDNSMLTAPNSFQRALACHELGHAIWGLGHEPQTATGTCMTPKIYPTTPTAYNAADYATIDGLYKSHTN